MTFKEILEQFHVPYAIGGEHKNVRSGFIGIECYLCGSGEGKYHAGYNLNTGWISCWRCGKLPLIKVLMELTGQPFHIIKELIGDLRKDFSLQFEKPKGTLRLPTGLSPLSKLHQDYLRSRGFNNIPELEKLWKLQGIGLAAKLPWRIFIPVQQRFKTVTWTTRSLVDEGIRYVNAKPEDEAVPIKSTLFGADYVGHAAVLCYSKDTEVLTPTGWKMFCDLDSKDQIAQYHKVDNEYFGMGTISFVKPTAKQILDYKGEMINYKAEWCDLLVTPDHRMLTCKQRCFPKVIKASEHYRAISLPTSGIFTSGDKETSIPNPLQARLLVAYAADGHWEKRGWKAIWYFHKERKQIRFESLLKALKISFDKGLPDPSTNRIRYSVYKAHIPFIDKFGPQKNWDWSMLNWPLETRLAVLAELHHWDGDQVVESTRFFTSKERDANIVSAMAILSGYSSALRKNFRRIRVKKPNHSDEFILSIKPTGWRKISKKILPKITYEDKVYCCTVPSGFLVVRRNGKAVISGNCEGPMDVMKIGPGAVCGFGMNLSAEQIRMFCKWPVRIICLDNESDAKRKAKQLYRDIQVMPGKTTLAYLEHAKDPGSAREEELNELREKLL